MRFECWDGGTSAADGTAEGAAGGGSAVSGSAGWATVPSSAETVVRAMFGFSFSASGFTFTSSSSRFRLPIMIAVVVDSFGCSSFAASWATLLGEMEAADGLSLCLWLSFDFFLG